MESFEIQWRSSTKKDLCNLPRQEVARVVSMVGELADNPLPRGSQKLSGSLFCLFAEGSKAMSAKVD